MTAGPDMAGDTTMSADRPPTAFWTSPLFFSIPSASPPMKSGIHFSYSRSGPVSGREKCRADRILFATALTASVTAEMADRIPFTIPMMRSLPHVNAWDASPFT